MTDPCRVSIEGFNMEREILKATDEYFSAHFPDISWRGHAQYMRAQNVKLETALEGLIRLCDRLKLLDEINCNDADVILAARKVLDESRGM